MKWKAMGTSFVLVSLAGASAIAQSARRIETASYVEHDVAGDQVVTFTGDELAGLSASPYGVLVRRPPGAVRVGLIRPRLNFVSELVKSVENL